MSPFLAWYVHRTGDVSPRDVRLSSVSSCDEAVARLFERHPPASETRWVEPLRTLVYEGPNQETITAWVALLGETPTTVTGAERDDGLGPAAEALLRALRA